MPIRCCYHGRRSLVKTVNTVGLVLGVVGAAGVSLVANFQETSVLSVHFTGASVCFGLGTIYLWIQVPCLARPIFF